jgi:endonuclease/exonuclease/phosphatase family metal-dependent hydrolase
MSLFSYKRWYLYLSLMVALFLGCWSCNEHGSNDPYRSPTSVTVMSYNIRNANIGHNRKYWNKRKKRLVNEVLFYNPDFMGIQEGLYRQVKYLDSHLTGRKYIGVGRRDGKMKGEYSAIFYNTKRFKLIPGTDSTMWLSSTPGKPSKGWDAALPRIVTWGEFRSKDTGKILYVFNTHFDNRGKKARAESAKLILKTIKKVAGDMPVVLTGDFNVPDQQKPSYKIMIKSFMQDARYASQLKPIGPEFTWVGGFDVCDTTHQERNDYIFVNKSLTVKKFAAISNFRHGQYPSDHIPIFSELLFKNGKQ